MGERPVADPTPRAVERDPLAARRDLEALCHAQDAGLAQRVVELAHRRLRLGRGRKALLTVRGRFTKTITRTGCLPVRAGVIRLTREQRAGVSEVALRQAHVTPV